MNSVEVQRIKIYGQRLSRRVYTEDEDSGLWVACVAGGISVGECCFSGGAARRVRTATRFAWRFRRQKSTPGTRIPPATQARLWASGSVLFGSPVNRN